MYQRQIHEEYDIDDDGNNCGKHIDNETDQAKNERFKSGDVVVCLKPNWLDTTLAVNEEFVFPVKDENEVNGIVSQVLPYTFATYSLQNTCHLTAHDKVLIDVSSTAQATALVRVALRAGSQVYAVSYSEDQTHALQAILGVEVCNAQSVPEDVTSNIVLTNGTLDLNMSRIKSVNNRSHLVLLPGQASLASTATLMPLFKNGLTVTFLDPLDIMSSDASGMSLFVEFSQFPQQVMSELQSSDSRVVLAFDTEKTLVPIRRMPEPLTFDGNNSYLLIGCLGGLGRSLTTWMIARGAKNFIFLSRSGADKPEAAALVADLEEMFESQNLDRQFRWYEVM
ncbi:t1pks [Epichloe bromicola]|uniref:T1pks n=1 Tax=Epichloe bromicola TaxID=79588 RepID=A0ABQ0CUZ9_9HYPO